MDTVKCLHCEKPVQLYDVINNGGIIYCYPNRQDIHFCPTCSNNLGYEYLFEYHFGGGSWKEFAKSFALFCYKNPIPSELKEIEDHFNRWVNETEAKHYYNKKI